jgi:iron(III) transport system substrate-binding protein
MPRGAAIALLFAAACRPAPPPPPVPEVRVYSTVGESATGALFPALEARRIGRARRVGAAGDAELLWLADPTEVIEAGAAVAAGDLPALDPEPQRFADPHGRFVPVAARGRVLVISPQVKLPFAPAHYRDLADARLAGRQALASPAGPNLLAVAALATVHGDDAVAQFLRLLARARPLVTTDDGEARRAVASGARAFALVSTEEAAAGAMSAAGLRVVWPDQDGRGAVLLPTALAWTSIGRASPPARRALAFLASAEAERLLVARVPGFLPLRSGVPVPEGMASAAVLLALPLDWDLLAEEKRRLAGVLRQWP